MIQCFDDVQRNGMTLAVPNGRYSCFSCSRIRSELLNAAKAIAELDDGDESFAWKHEPLFQALHEAIKEAEDQ